MLVFWTLTSIVLVFSVNGQFWDLRGDFCRTRKPQTCCPGRDDECTVPILDTLCYCDIFCNRTSGADCCPDFWPTCLGINPPGPIVTQQCFKDGRSYNVGESIKINCNKCTCRQRSPTNYDFVCEQNVCLVRPELIESINHGNYGWKASNYSFLWGKTLEEGIQYRLGTFKPTVSTMAMNEVKIKMRKELPENFDARQHWHNLIHPVRDQGDCGSSWAFSTTSLASDRLAIQSRGSMNMALSPQHLISCETRGQKGCDGGHLDRAWFYLKRHGVASEECYPYESGTSKENGRCAVRKPRGRHGHILCTNGQEDMVHKSTPAYRIGPQEDLIRQEIFNYGPVQATFKVYNDFFLYKGGVYRHTNLSDGKPEAYRLHGWHSVRIIGWGIDRTGRRPVKYWLCDNSWGRLWGEDGYFRIIRGEDECDIEMFIIGVWANTNSNNMNGIGH
uniref:Putative cysteine proteinase n=1 Tax=Superstitionia donensis TaxID=311983 RepID=A0A1V1WBX6_9SCOR